MSHSRPAVDLDALDALVQRHRAGDPAALQQLLEHVNQRLRSLAHRMLRDFPRLRRWEDTGDVLQNALLRLWRTLESFRPESAGQFLGLASREIRRELIDLTRHHFGPEGVAGHYDSRGDENSAAATPDLANSSSDPALLARWREFHEQVNHLPEDERQAFDHVFYQGLSYAEAGRSLEVSDNTIRTRYLSALLRLRRALKGESPL